MGKNRAVVRRKPLSTVLLDKSASRRNARRISDALSHAQLVLSVTRLPREIDKSPYWLIQPVATTLDELRNKAEKAQTVLKTALKPPACVFPFRKSR
jgi:hypothetical protein